MPELFISHSSSDDAFVSRLSVDLRRAGVDSWVDHEDIAPGLEWDHAVEQAINQCKSMVFVVTRESLESEVCRDEWNLAVEKDKLVIPILRSGSLGYDDLPLRLKRKQTIDFRGNYDLALKQLISALGLEKKTSPLSPLPYDPDDETTYVPTKLPPLDWIEIPAGDVVIFGAGDTEITYSVPAFSITKYPLSVGQFEFFINNDGYQKQELWTPEGWEWRKKNVITLPQFWRVERWHAAKRPVVGVSWYEAVAFANWLSIHLSGDASIRVTLPTEQQWQRAAQGDDRRLYPWGDAFDSSRCNTDEGGIGKTSSIDQFHGGISPFGVYDMVGNVYEWCLNEWGSYEPGTTNLGAADKRAIRGGSWRLDHKTATCISRAFSQPTDRFSFIGFRLVLT